MYHMGGTEHLLTTLMSGGQGFVIDGFNAAAIADIVSEHPIGWLMLVPATIRPMIDEMARRGVTARGVRAVGCMADLVPSADIAAISIAVNAPYLNSFGATETGMPPLSGGLLPPAAPVENLAKKLSVLSELRLVGADGQTVRNGEVGEAWVRGPTLFSGYWNAEAANAECFDEGWYRMGDLFQHSACGYTFVGRSKYLIKSGGENIYPAEIERLLLADPRVADAIVVRAPDAHWGEVPVAVVARADPALDKAALEAMLAGALARYKRPREIHFIELGQFPRNASGKILREAVEQMVREQMANSEAEPA
jgi:fatty-acyl-CoA synthase